MSLAQSLPARVVRTLINRIVGDDLRTVRIRSGIARGCRMELDLSKEKAYWLGWYELGLQKLLRSNVGVGDVVYDVGAHVGFFSMCAARLGARVVAIEPDPANAARLRMTAELNGFDFAIVEAAAWSESGHVGLRDGGSSKEISVGPGADVPTVTLDKLARRYPPPTVIKLDVEGAEGAVLAGARGVLEMHAPTLVCEIHGDEQRVAVLALLARYDIEELGIDRIVARPRVKI